jgi:hypothetical protein
MESLQSEEEDEELWIDFPYMQNLLEHYLHEGSSESDGEYEDDYEAASDD